MTMSFERFQKYYRIGTGLIWVGTAWFVCAVAVLGERLALHRPAIAVWWITLFPVGCVVASLLLLLWVRSR